ncbi:MAG TPA: PilN domain-containing protein [Flavobacterium sp.]|nr:PilN domain-containing protein [Flavobacterium sp.]
MENILAKIFKIRKLHVIGVRIGETDQVYHVLTAHKKRNKIELLSTQSFSSIEQLCQAIDMKLPVIMVVDGKAVLTKAVDFKNEADASWYKNIDLEAIYFTRIDSEENSFISFCRRSAVEDARALFENNGFQLAGIYVGALLSVLLYDSIRQASLVSGDLLLQLKSGQLASISKKETPENVDYLIGTDTVSSTFLPLYGTLLDFFLHPGNVVKTTSATLKTDDIIYKKAFDTVGIAMVIFFFTALLGSYSLIQYFGTQNAKLNLEKVYSNESYQLIVDMENQRNEKQQLLNESGFLSKKFLSYYAYEIMNAIPSDISLNGLAIAPVDKEIKANAKMQLETKKILINGETYNDGSFNEWIQQLKKTPWLKNFEIKSFKKDKDNKSHFEITITIKDV